MSIRRLFAVDLGASGGKCFCGTFDDGRFSMQEVHRFSHEGVPFHVPDRRGRVSERMHWDDTFLHRNILAGLQAVARDMGRELDSVGIDAWGADGHLFSEDGDMLGKMYCYRDHRLDGMQEKVKARISPERIYAITGIHFQPFNISNQLHWFVQNRSDLLRPRSFFLPAPSIFYFYLGGARMVDSTWASVTQLMDARTKRWSAEILASLEIPPEILPPIVAPGAVVGELHRPLAESLGITRAKLVAVGSHDTASAFAAAPVDRADEALIISSGTWSLIGKLVPEPITSKDAMAANISNEGGIGNIRLLKNCMGTWLIQELRRAWAVADGKEMAWPEITRLAAAAKPFGSFVDPDDPGFYNPPNMERAIADACVRTGQPVPADRGAFLRLVYESLALKYRVVNEQICRVCGTTTRAVNIVGGGSRNEMLNQFTADSLGLPVFAGPEEATAVGNLVVQAVGLGILGSVGDALPIVKAAFPIREYRPGDVAGWRAAALRFRKLISG
jgi:rhamnulokinase